MMLLRGLPLSSILLLTVHLALTGCVNDATTLAQEPSLLDQDDVSPTCPGLKTVTIASGPSLSLVWAEARDNFSQASKINYKIYIKKNNENYDLISPGKIIEGGTSTLVTNGISVGNTYTTFVTCSDEKGNTAPTGPANEMSILVADSQPPAAINNLVADHETFNSILLTWSPSDDGLGGTTAANMRYKIYASTTSPVSTAGSPLTTVLNGATSYIHTGLSPATTWYYKVVALDALDNASAASNEATGTTLTDTTSPTFTGNVAGLVVNSTSTSAISISWAAAADLVTSSANLGYRIYRCAGSTSCNPFLVAPLTTVTGVVTYNDIGLSSSTVYVYGVRAVDSSGNVSINTDQKITSTTYSSTGSFYAYPTVEEINIRFGQSIAIANVVGAATGATAYPDLIVGAPNMSEAGSAYRYTGCVFIFPGTAVGTFSTTPTKVVCQPNAIASGTQNNLNFGYAVATGDLDNDGYDDIVITNPLRFKVYIYRTLNTAGVLSVGSTGIPITHPTSNTTFGVGLCIGDSDGVGGADLFIATTTENCDVACSGVTGTGNLLVFNNTSTPGTFVAPTTLSYRISPAHSLIAAGYNLANNEVVVRSCTLGKFDPNNTTQTQLVIGSGTVSYGAGAATDGMVAFYRKTAANTFAFQNVYPTSTPSVTGNNWGQAVSKIRLNGTTDSLIVGAPLDSSAGSSAGAAYLYTVGTTASNFILTDTGTTFYGGSDFDSNSAGIAVAAADFWGHGDGKQDLVVGAYLDDNTLTLGASSVNNGQAFTYRNNAGTLSTVASQGDITAGTQFNISSYNVKTHVAYGSALCKGDVNNDGFTDVIVGAPLVDFDSVSLATNQDVGAVYVYYGVAAGEIDFSKPSQIIYAPGDQNSSYFGNSCVVMDYNADGKQDLVVGSPYRDLVQADRGAVFIYYGAANSPLPSSNSATINSPLALATSLFGWSLAKGDFDNNGYDDLAISSIGYTNGINTALGTVYIFWADNTTHAIGPANMTTLLPPDGNYLSGTNPNLQNPQAWSVNLNFGRAMESFKTVTNSSGVDLIACSMVGDVGLDYYYLGSPAATDIGKCWIYEGKVNSGLAGSYTMSTWPKNEIRYPSGFSTPANSIYFGSGLTKGDWNSDGTDDLILCASRQANLVTTTALAGACFAYYGVSTGGFSQYDGYRPNSAGTRFVPQPDAFHYNPNGEPATASRFGDAVLMLDINNNTTPDLLIGEPYSDNPSAPTNLGADSGRVYIIRGGF